MTSTDWPTAERPGIAIVAPTGFGTFGVWWRDFPAMERRGGYSGPYRTRDEASESALSWGAYFECPVSVDHRDEKPE